MIRRANILVLLCLLCPTVWAEVYTIDFNRGTVNGTTIKTKIDTSVPQENYCTAGADLFSLHSDTQYSYYNDNGCGILLSSSAKTGMFVFLLDDDKYITKVVAYASKVSGNTKSELDLWAAIKKIKTFSNEELQAYSAGSSASTDYQLPDITVNERVKKIKFQATAGGYVMLHRIDIYIADEVSLTLPAQSSGTNYATFSNDKATFFPSDVTVSKVAVSDGHLVVSSLETQDGFGTTGCYVPANTGVLLASASSNVSYYTLESETLNALTGNMLKPASEPMTGSGKFYKLAYDDYDNRTGLGFYWGAENGGSFTCEEGTAYLYVPGSYGVKGYVLDDSTDEDAIHSPMEFIDEKGIFYNLSGQRISKPMQGIYIRDGRKSIEQKLF